MGFEDLFWAAHVGIANQVELYCVCSIIKKQLSCMAT